MSHPLMTDRITRPPPLQESAPSKESFAHTPPVSKILRNPVGLQKAEKPAAPGGPSLPAGPVGGDSQVEPATLTEVVSQINDYVQNLRRELQFSVDEASGRTVIKVIDSETEEVIRQIPPEEVLRISEVFEQSAGLLLRAEV